MSTTGRRILTARTSTRRAGLVLLAPLLMLLAALLPLGGTGVASAALADPPAQGDINTIAGIGNGASIGPAVEAALNGPSTVACASGGNPCYIAEANVHRVRKVDNGTISTFAGNGKQGYSGDGGPAISASLNTPSGLAVDSGGNVYVSDAGNHVVREITPDGNKITTFAGGGTSVTSGPATSLRLLSPAGLAYDNGLVYVTDFVNRRVFRISTTSGNFSVYAGSGNFGYASTTTTPATAANLATPSAIAFDAAGNGYIADSVGNRIYKVTPGATGTLSWFAGISGTPPLAGFADGPLTAGAKFFQPSGIAVRTTTVQVTVNDPQTDPPSDPPPSHVVNVLTQSVIVADTQNNRLRAIPLPVPSIPDAQSQPTNPDGDATNVSTVLGSNTAGSTGNGGPASAARTNKPVDVVAPAPDQLLFVSSTGNTVRKITTTAGQGEKDGTVSAYAGNGSASLAGDNGPATDAQLAGPQGVALDSQGDYYVADTFNQAVRKIDPTSGVITTVAGTGSKTKVDSGPGSDLGDGGPATSATLNFPGGVAVNAAGDIFIADTYNNRVRMVDHATHAITTVAGDGTFGYKSGAGNPTSIPLAQPFGVAVLPDQSLLIADSFAVRVFRVTNPGGQNAQLTTFAGSGGNLLGDGGPATQAALGLPVGLAVDPMGNTYIATTASDTSNSRIRKVDPSGKITTVAGGGTSTAEGVAATSANLTALGGVAVDPLGEVFVADSARNRVRRVNPNGTIETMAGVTTAGFDGDGHAATSAKMAAPIGLAFAPDTGTGATPNQGSLLIADSGNSRVRAVTGVTTGSALGLANFVNAAYHDFLGVAPNAAQTGSGVLTSGPGMAGRTTFLSGLSSSTAWVTNVVNQFYLDILGRTGDAGSVTQWVAWIRNGTFTVAQVAGNLYGSREYYANFGDPDSEDGLPNWVEDLYLKLLHRASDSAGKAFWINQVAAHGGGVKGRSWVAFQIFQSTESSYDRVTNLYEVRCGNGAPEPPCPTYRPLLNRAPEAGALPFWGPKVIAQGDLVLAASLAASTEYYLNSQSRTFS
ncbi:MAG TPA: DUF4214 domain-containing protein [Acidimicrobiales bacterium]|jgi:hypothetical protein|nr:DUF4214 domain-containing protein [Acidimicrobiales bacterium]